MCDNTAKKCKNCSCSSGKNSQKEEQSRSEIPYTGSIVKKCRELAHQLLDKDGDIKDGETLKVEVEKVANRQGRLDFESER